jgi:hypothetical protein
LRLHGKDDAGPFYGKDQTRLPVIKTTSPCGDRFLLLSLDISDMPDFPDSDSRIRDASIFHASALFPF